MNITCSNGAVRLADGLTEYEGRVEICYDNHWGGVCGNYWDNSEANVVCRQLGKIPVGERCMATVIIFISCGLVQIRVEITT